MASEVASHVALRATSDRDRASGRHVDRIYSLFTILLHGSLEEIPGCKDPAELVDLAVKQRRSDGDNLETHVADGGDAHVRPLAGRHLVVCCGVKRSTALAWRSWYLTSTTCRDR